MPDKPYAEACDQNKGPILEVLSQYLGPVRRLLEIGSGTGQHAVFFARHFPDLTWQPSDRPENLEGIEAWIHDEGPSNVQPPIHLDVNALHDWPAGPFDAVFSANCLHIMHWGSVQRLFEGIGQVLMPEGLFIVYGPFNYGGRYTSESNARFDAWLRERDPDSGIRDIDDLTKLARANDLKLYADHPMPANNRTLVWRKSAS